jgi:hypothetical protein
MVFHVLLTEISSRWVIRVMKCPACAWHWFAATSGDEDQAMRLACEAIERHVHEVHEHSTAANSH